MKRVWKYLVYFVFFSSLIFLWLGAADFWHTDLVPRWLDATITATLLFASVGEIKCRSQLQ